MNRSVESYFENTAAGKLLNWLQRQFRKLDELFENSDDLVVENPQVQGKDITIIEVYRTHNGNPIYDAGMKVKYRQKPEVDDNGLSVDTDFYDVEFLQSGKGGKHIGPIKRIPNSEFYRVIEEYAEELIDPKLKELAKDSEWEGSFIETEAESARRTKSTPDAKDETINESISVFYGRRVLGR